MESPPKRVTRARAAAKSKAPAPVKVATAAAKAKATKTMPPPAAPVLAPAAPVTRRRTRGMTEEIEEESTQGHEESTQQDELEPEKKTARTTRGRATRGKTVQTPVEESTPETPMDAPTAKPATRTRRPAVKKAVEETPVEVAAIVPLPEEEPEEAPKPAPSRITRRVRKVEVAPEEPEAPVAAPPKRNVRSRAATTTKPVATKKTVEFAEAPERDKENVVAPAPAKAKRVISAPVAAKEPEPAATGLRAKPVRKPAAKAAPKPLAKAAIPAPRATRGRAVSVTSTSIPIEEPIKSPLSPKKVSQLPQPTPKQTSPKEKEDSDDELATMEKTPMRPLEKTLFTAPASVLSTAKKLDFTTSVIAHPVSTTQSQELGASIMASPARRIPQSPWKGAIKDSAKKPGPEIGQSLLQSPKKLGSSFMSSPFKSQMAPPSSSHKSIAQKQTLMQSPARRPPSPVKVSRNGSPTRAGPSRDLFGATPKASTFGISKFATPKTLTKRAFRPGKVAYSSNRPQTEAKPSGKDATAPTPTFGDIKPFTGRLSSVLPRYADPVMRGEIGTPVAPSTSEGTSELVDALAGGEAPAANEDHLEVAQDENPVPSTEIDEGNQITEEEAQAATIPLSEFSKSTTPTASPPAGFMAKTSTYAPRDESPFDDSESDNESEDELATNSPMYTVKMSSQQFAQLSTPKKKLNFQGSKTPVAIGFTPLASQLNSWHAPTPAAQGMSFEQTLVQESPSGKGVATPARTQSEEQMQAAPTPLAGPSPAVPSSFFDDEMMIREDENMMELYAEDGGVEEDVVLDALEFAPEDIDDEDLDLVMEANELSMIEEMEEMDDYLIGQDEDDDDLDAVMQSGESSGKNSAEQSGQQSPMETAQDATSAEVVGFADDAVVNAFNHSMDSAISEASQEYGDENAPPAEAVPTSVPVEQVAAPTPLSTRKREKMPSTAPTPLGARRLSTSKVTPKPSTPLALTSRRSSRPFTPARVITEQRTVHTISKVPLKPAAAESPIKFSPRKMPATVARGGSQIPRAQMPTASSSTRSTNTTPTNMRAGGMRSVSTPTPTKATGNTWSNTATPARTPVRPAAEGVLRGAVVFVDVHTTEGADASAVFFDLLSQMGARCVKSWGWNPSISPLSSLNSLPPADAQLSGSTSSNEDSESDSRKIGITHVVFKDGSKRTMEKVRDTKGVVSCVGVGWVLDCEREARWLDEAEYRIDTAHIPRGGARRRKSMEPRALANMNGTLVTPGGGSKSGIPQTEKIQKFGRRDSTQWTRNLHEDSDATPKSKKVDSDGDIDMLDYSYAELSPLPQTPAPAKIEEYSQHVLDKINGLAPETPYHFDNQLLFGQAATPYIGDSKTPKVGFTPYTGTELTPIAGTPADIGETPQPLTVQKVAEDRNQMIMRTVPVKRNDGAREEMGSGMDSQALMQRLMLARRKSLQWAPKVGSPLARGSVYSQK